jgi:hypothetical protein
MIKHIDYVYFNIYSYFYRLSQYRQIVNPRMQAMYMFALGSGGWLLLFETLYLHLFKHHRFASKMESTVFAGTIYMLTAAFFHYIFIIRDRDLKIVGKYEALTEGHPKRKLHLILSLSVLLLPYALMVCSALIFPRKN